MPACLIGLGSNQGDRQSTLDATVAELRRQSGITVTAVSRWHETAPVGGPANQECFLNGALTAETSLSPVELLASLQEIENRLGRTRVTRWGPRTIDLDLLLYGECVLNTPSLVLPHPRMAWRRFVLEPAAEVAGNMLHSTTRWTIARLLEHLNSTARYVAITGPIAAGKSHLAQQLSTSLNARLITEQPDWSRLEAFYANTADHAWDIEREFLRQRAELLSVDNLYTSNSGWTVSDFWFDQSAAFARAWLSAEQAPAFLRQFEQAQKNAVKPKLVVLLDLPASELLARVGQRGRACEKRLTLEQLDRIRREVLRQVCQTDVGPVLRITADNQETALTEVLAAVQGME